MKYRGLNYYFLSNDKTTVHYANPLMQSNLSPANYFLFHCKPMTKCKGSEMKIQIRFKILIVQHIDPILWVL